MLCDWVDNNIDDTLAFYRVPREYHKHVKANAGARRRNPRGLDRSRALPEHEYAQGTQETRTAERRNTRRLSGAPLPQGEGGLQEITLLPEERQLNQFAELDGHNLPKAKSGIIAAAGAVSRSTKRKWLMKTRRATREWMVLTAAWRIRQPATMCFWAIGVTSG